MKKARYAIMFVLLGLTGCSSHADKRSGESPVDDGRATSQVLRRGLPGEPETLDPQLAEDTYSSQVLRDIYEGLTAEDPAGRVIAGIAKSWDIDGSGTVYTFHLRKDAKWSDGSPILASEFVAGMRRAVDPKTASQSAGLLSIIKGAVDITAGHRPSAELGVTMVNDETVQMTLEHPAPYILEILAQPIAAPLHHSEGNFLVPIARAGMVSDGPYYVSSRVRNSFIQLERNPYYWNTAGTAIKTVRYVIVESENTELNEFNAGQLDLTFTVPIAEVSLRISQHDTQLQMTPTLGTFYLALNLRKSPLEDNIGLRQALSMSIDRDAIARNILMGVTPAYGFVAAGTAHYGDTAYVWSTWDDNRRLNYARLLYKQAGFSKSKALHLKLYFNSDEGVRRVMLAIATAWKQELGVETELQSEEFRVFLSGRMDRSKWDVVRLGWNADYNDASSFLEIFTTVSGENDAGYASPVFDAAVRSARLEPRQAERMAILIRSEELFLNDYPIIPIYFYKSRRLVKPYLGGVQITPMNHTFSRHLYWKTA